MLRADLAQIATWIESNSRILDLGCGDGALLKHLRDSHNCAGYGIEIADASVLECVRRRVNVIQADLESGLRMFADGMFDTVVLSQTLQAMHHVEAILREMIRVGRRGIVSFPNFGNWRHAVSLLSGHMPVTPEIPYQWYTRRTSTCARPRISSCLLRAWSCASPTALCWRAVSRWSFCRICAPASRSTVSRGSDREHSAAWPTGTRAPGFRWRRSRRKTPRSQSGRPRSPKIRRRTWG